MALREVDLTYVRDLVRRRAAIVLEPSKEYLIEARLRPLVRAMGVGSIDALVLLMRTRGDEALKTKVVEALTTNETTFFRDVHPFDALREQVLPALIQARRGRRALTIWSAACSAGQEPYSVAMLLRDGFPELQGWTVQILATDLSSGMIERAREGIYGQLEVNRGLPARMLVTHFDKQDGCWQIHEGLRRAVRFSVMNLVEPWPAMPTVDILFLRNVLIYFDAGSRARVLERARGVLAPDGYLFLGGSEMIASGKGFVPARFGRALAYQPCEAAAG